jgi:hypothetical protein
LGILRISGVWQGQNWALVNSFSRFFAERVFTAVFLPERSQEAEASYSRLLAQHAESDFDPMDAETRLRALVLDKPLVPLTTKSGRVFFLRRAPSDGGMSRRIFRTELSAVIGEEAIGFWEFKVWWRRSPVLVFYYPHRHRLGLRPRFEFEELFDGAAPKRTVRQTARACFHALVSRFRSACGLPVG